jgi:hypothetical protein
MEYIPRSREAPTGESQFPQPFLAKVTSFTCPLAFLVEWSVAFPLPRLILARPRFETVPDRWHGVGVRVERRDAHAHLTPASFNADFSAVAHDQGLLNPSRTVWFDASLCLPTSTGVPSSTSVASKNRSFGPSFASHLDHSPRCVHARGVILSKDGRLRLMWNFAIPIFSISSDHDSP